MLGLEGVAARAFCGTSFSPEKRAAQYVAGYESEVAADIAKMREQAVKGGTEEIVEDEIARYVAGYRQRASAYLASHSRVMSTMITGGSNFPVRRMQKINAVVDKRSNELSEFRERAMKAAMRNLRPDLAPIMSGDANAVERLSAELATLEAKQARMKAVNAASAKFKKNPASLESAALSDEDKALIRGYVPQYSWEPNPFAPHELSNNSANVRRVKARIEMLQALKAQPVVEIESKSANGVRLEDDPPANRVRLFFPGKPAEEIRSKLKSGGFRWAPSIGAWQGYRNYRTMELAKSFVQATEA